MLGFVRAAAKVVVLVNHHAFHLTSIGGLPQLGPLPTPDKIISLVLCFSLHRTPPGDSHQQTRRAVVVLWRAFSHLWRQSSARHSSPTVLLMARTILIAWNGGIHTPSCYSPPERSTLELLGAGYEAMKQVKYVPLGDGAHKIVHEQFIFRRDFTFSRCATQLQHLRLIRPLILVSYLNIVKDVIGGTQAPPSQIQRQIATRF